MTAKLDTGTLLFTRSIDSSGDLEIRANGEVILTPGVRYDAVRIEYVLRGHNNEILKRDDSTVDMLIARADRATFAHYFSVKFPLVARASRVEARVIARTYAVDEVRTVELKGMQDLTRKANSDDLQKLVEDLQKL